MKPSPWENGFPINNLFIPGEDLFVLLKGLHVVKRLLQGRNIRKILLVILHNFLDFSKDFLEKMPYKIKNGGTSFYQTKKNSDKD